MLDAYRPSWIRENNPEAAIGSGIFLILAGIGTWATGVNALFFEFEPLPPSSLLDVFAQRAVYYLLGYGLAGLAYIRLRDLDVAWSLLNGDTMAVVLAGGVLPVLLVGAVSVLANTAFGVSVSSFIGTTYSVSASWLDLLRIGGAFALFNSIGLGIVFFGVVHERLRQVATPSHAVALTAVVALFFELLAFDATALDRPQIALFVISVVMSIVVGLAGGLVYRSVIREGTVEGTVAVLREGPHVPVVIAGTVGTLLLLTGLAEFPDAIIEPMWMVAVGVGALVYERARSIWPAVLVIFVYEFSLDLAVYLEGVLGLVAV